MSRFICFHSQPLFFLSETYFSTSLYPSHSLGHCVGVSLPIFILWFLAVICLTHMSLSSSLIHVQMLLNILVTFVNHKINGPPI